MRLEALGLVCGDDLFRSIPQMGEVTFRNGFGGTRPTFDTRGSRRVGGMYAELYSAAGLARLGYSPVPRYWYV